MHIRTCARTSARWSSFMGGCNAFSRQTERRKRVDIVFSKRQPYTYIYNACDLRTCVAVKPQKLFFLATTSYPSALRVLSSEGEPLAPALMRWSLLWNALVSRPGMHPCLYTSLALRPMTNLEASRPFARSELWEISILTPVSHRPYGGTKPQSAIFIKISDLSILHFLKIVILFFYNIISFFEEKY